MNDVWNKDPSASAIGTRSALEATIREAQRIIKYHDNNDAFVAAMIMSSGGELYASDRDLVASKDVAIETRRDEANRRWVIRCKE